MCWLFGHYRGIEVTVQEYINIQTSSASSYSQIHLFIRSLQCQAPTFKVVDKLLVEHTNIYREPRGCINQRVNFDIEKNTQLYNIN